MKTYTQFIGKGSLTEAGIKGKSNKTGETFGMVVGSDRETRDGYELTIRVSYGSRMGAYKFTFDEDSNLIEIYYYGFRLDGKIPDMDGGDGSYLDSVRRPSKKETLSRIAKITNPSFAKKIHNHVLSNNLREEVVNEAGNLKLSTSQMKQLHNAYKDLSKDVINRMMRNVVKREKFLSLIKKFDRPSLEKLVKMDKNAPFSKAVQAYLDGKIKEGVVNEGLLREGDRPLSAIAVEIRRDWKNVNYAAKPYLDAMSTLDSINDNYFMDSAASIVRYFLANASTWRGETAKRIKLELKAMLKR